MTTIHYSLRENVPFTTKVLTLELFSNVLLMFVVFMFSLFAVRLNEMRMYNELLKNKRCIRIVELLCFFFLVLNNGLNGWRNRVFSIMLTNSVCVFTFCWLIMTTFGFERNGKRRVLKMQTKNIILIYCQTQVGSFMV